MVGLVCVRNDKWIIVSTKHMTGFTHMHLPLSVITREYYAHNRIDLLLYSVITHEYKGAQQKLLATHQQSLTSSCASHVTQAQHMSYLQNFLRHEVLLAFFCNFGVSCTVYTLTV